MIIINTKIQKTLISMGEEEYRDFSSALMPTVEKSRVIGIRVPVLRKFAKEMEDFESASSGFLQHFRMNILRKIICTPF